MPVPVPRLTKPRAHPVTKPHNRVLGQTIPSQNVTGSLPFPPLGPLPSFGNREEWNSSLPLPSWRRNKQRLPSGEDCRPTEQPNLQDFYQGLTAADNASVIKGAHAEACIPPMYNLLRVQQLPTGNTYPREHQGMHGDMDDGMDAGFSTLVQAQFDSNMQWDVDFLVGREEIDVHRNSGSTPAEIATDPAALNTRSYQAGAFSPIFEDQSPGSADGPDNGSSPLEPVTPFGDFVDRAVADAQSYAAFDNHYAERNAISDYYQDKQVNLETYQAPPVFPTLIELPKAQDPIPDTVTPSPTVRYKKLSEPLSEWVAAYVWKVCTTGFSLPPAFTQPSMNAGPYVTAAPSYLAPSIHSLLLSTLLQPSAVLLAVWYIVRLPVYFGAAPLNMEFAKERAFRAALLGDGYAGFETDTSEASAAFRLVVLGCMLANKWLDDHTFSNKTWHSISNIPIQTLNKLESLTLDIFSYDLSISSQQWSQWLAHVMSYHMSLSSPTYPQPISRPSSNPHSIVRRAIEEITQAPSASKSASNVPQPIFLGLEERLKEKLEKEVAMDVLEIDLDEDGPLREEYLPKRRASKLGSQSAQLGYNAGLVQGQHLGGEKWNVPNVPSGKALPPPAKWSPAGDEPILRDRNRVTGQYVAVQAPPVPMATYPASYQPHDVAYNQNWNPAVGYMPVKSQSSHMQDVSSVFRVSHAYNPFGHVPALAIPHARSHSLSYDQDNSRNHMRSYSQSRFEYKHSDLYMMASEHIPAKDTATKWMEQASGYLGYSQPYIRIPAVGMQPAW
ncbi:hypothetical protein BDZ97DRAFT_1947510 [Flammula alnicola]|nr:hypothetical protein BDZ97DRAFT_1947510 [Flammula alnicola]